MEIALREATEVDLPAILSLYAQLGQDDGTVLDLEEAGRIFTRLKSYPDYRMYVALADRTVIGTFTLLIMDNIAHRGARSAILEDVVVAEGLRGQGVGKEMMRYAGNLCRDKGCYKLVLSSNRNRAAAHRFYESLGFARHGYSFSMTYATTEPDFCDRPTDSPLYEPMNMKVNRDESCRFDSPDKYHG
jgi:GNAT superfamily N-acetyltransferase